MSAVTVGRMTAAQERIRRAIVEIAQSALDGDDDSTALRLVGREAMARLLEVLRTLVAIEEAGMLIWFCELVYAVGRHNLGDLSSEGPGYWDDMMAKCLDRLTGTR